MPQITSVEPRIRMPACRSASPKNLSTRPESTSDHYSRREFGDRARALDLDPALRYEP